MKAIYLNKKRAKHGTYGLHLGNLRTGQILIINIIKAVGTKAITPFPIPWSICPS